MRIDQNKFETLQKILNLLENSDFISIKDSKINNIIGNNIVYCNLTSILGNNFNLDIINPKKYLKLFKSVKSNFTLIEEDSRYILYSNELKIFLPKKINTSSISFEDIGDLSEVGKLITIKDNKKIIKNLIGNPTKLLIHNNEFKGILEDNFGIYIFPEYNDNNEEINEENSKILMSYGFLNIDSNEYILKLGIDSSNKYWLLTQIKFDNIINLFTLENVNPKTENILI